MLSFQIFVNPVGEKYYLSTLLICISLIMNKTEHIFICLRAIYVIFVNVSSCLLIISQLNVLPFPQIVILNILEVQHFICDT